ncbi:TolC family protein [Candidatus Nitronereus thalassa]|uniref:TolC family protein n=1 Tax=Candidatus Nitronereus thalassa TaxID=3020898 RepID=A0ABU3KBT0_9BACT|nr:TolC family protein [Candidatus Nitronereus thalassa]MDT7043689.1 TolC family protein [Candidatus Nitronereus thalassa]
MQRKNIIWGQLFLLSTFLLGTPGFLSAEEQDQKAKILELRPLIQEALQNNPEVAAFREQLKAMQERIPQARTLEDPEVKIQLWNTPETLDVTGTQRTIYGVAQRFPFPGVLSQQEEVAAREADQAAQRLAAKEREIMAAIKAAYYDLFYAHKAIEIHHEQIKLLKQFFKIANAKFRVGKGTQVEVLQAQVELSKLFQHLPVLEQRRQTAQAHLNTLLNRRAQAPLGAPRKPASQHPLQTHEQLVDQALRLRPELQEIDLAVAQFESATKLARLQYYPKLRVELQRWQNHNTDDGFGGNVTMNIPFSFWTKPKYDAGVREATARVRVARSKKQTLENQTRFQIKDLVAQIEATGQVVELYATTVLPQAKQTLKAANAGYRTDRTDFLDLIDAERALITYQLEYFRALVDREQQVAALERVLGVEL